MQMMQPIEDIISLVATRGRLSVDDVEQAFDLPNDSTRNIIDFLVKFDFLRKVEGKYLVITDTCRPFLKEIFPDS